MFRKDVVGMLREALLHAVQKRRALWCAVADARVGGWGHDLAGARLRCMRFMVLLTQAMKLVPYSVCQSCREVSGGRVCQSRNRLQCRRLGAGTCSVMLPMLSMLPMLLCVGVSRVNIPRTGGVPQWRHKLVLPYP